MVVVRGGVGWYGYRREMAQLDKTRERSALTPGQLVCTSISLLGERGRAGFLGTDAKTEKCKTRNW